MSLVFERPELLLLTVPAVRAVDEPRQVKPGGLVVLMLGGLAVDTREDADVGPVVAAGVPSADPVLFFRLLWIAVGDHGGARHESASDAASGEGDAEHGECCWIPTSV